MTESKLDFWNERAKLADIAGSNDFILKELEQRLILSKIPSGSSILDIGCGNGDTLIKLAVEKGCTGIGVDFSEGMIMLATQALKQIGKSSRCSFRVAEVLNLPPDLGQFDFAISERCLINLDSSHQQHLAFLSIMNRVKPGGFYLMIESSNQGLDRTNNLRKALGLELMSPPWHNTFFDEGVVESWATDRFALQEVIPFSSTYHFLSRVVYAGISAKTGETLRYDSDINLLSLKLPIIGNFGPARLWLWLKKSE